MESQRRGREFALMMSRRCNIACRHCGIESAPHVRDMMPLASARQFIVEAAGIPDFAKVTFTGGEPMLRPDDMETLLRLCAELGLATRVVTNGFWARHRDRGIAMMRRMTKAGLSEINFSADKYHLEFMPAATLRNALDCAADVGLTRIVSYVSNSDHPPLDEFGELYGIPRERLVDLRAVLRGPDPATRLAEDRIFVFYGGLIGLGRAAEHPEELRFVSVDVFAEGAGCGEIINKPVIYPDGSFQACCCAGGKIASFTVGNAFAESIGTLYARMLSRPHYQLINTLGPKTLFDAVRRARPDADLPTRVTSICEMCVHASGCMGAAELDAVAEEEMVRGFLDLVGVGQQAGAPAELTPA